MKKKLALLCVCCTLISCLFLTGCGPQGLSMIKLSDVQGSFYDDYSGTKDAYLCKIKEDAPADLTIPAEYQGKPVVAVETASVGPQSLDSLTVEDGIQIVDEIVTHMENAPESITLPTSVHTVKWSFTDSDGLEKVVIEGDLKKLDGCFNNCAGLKSVEIRGKVGMIDSASFCRCSSLETIVIDGDVDEIDNSSFGNLPALKELVFKGSVKNVAQEKYVSRNIFTNCPMLKEVKYASCPDGSMEQALMNLNASETDDDIIIEAAMKKLGTAFDPDKEIKDTDAPQYAETLNGPILSMMSCADCPYQEYGADTVPADVKLWVDDLDRINDAFPDTVLTAEKTKALANGADTVYCLVERIGYSDGPEYMMSVSGYYMHYRISLWNSNTDELLAWYTESVGEAPFSYKVGEEQIYYSYPTGDGTKNYLKDENKKEPTAISIVERDFYGVVDTGNY